MRTLVVEDDLVMREFYKEILGEYGSVDFAENGTVAIEVFTSAHEKGHPFDLVCLDIVMPEIDGLEVLKSFRKQEEDRGVLGLAGAKIIICSGLGDSKSVLGAFRDGCEAYLVKPFDKRMLLTKLVKLGLVSRETAERRTKTV